MGAPASCREADGGTKVIARRSVPLRMSGDEEPDELPYTRSRNRVFCATPEMNLSGGSLLKGVRRLFGSD